LNHYLFRLKIKASPACPNCGSDDEDRNHFLNQCPAYDEIRCKLIRKNSDVLQYWPVSNKKWWLDKKRNVGILLEYIISTKRFESS
ncbi:unnamed protein product, partial [Heterosigma akashiwo]